MRFHRFRRCTPVLFFVALPFVSGCAPEAGSEGWCKAMEARPASEWSFKDTAEFAKSCVVTLPGKVGSEAWCKEQKEKPPADWSVNDARNFARECIVR